MRRTCAKHVAAVALLSLGVVGCAQIIGIEEPSEGDTSTQKDASVTPPDTRPDGGVVLPPGGDAGGPGPNPGVCADLPLFKAPSNYGGIGTRPTSLAVGDLNQDSIPDVVIADEQGSLTVLFGGQGGMPGVFGGNLTVQATATPPCSPGVFSVAIGDFDGDTRNDLAYISGQGCTPHLVVRRQNAAPGSFAAEQVVTTFAMAGGGTFGLNAGKLNADGRSDLVVLSGEGIQVFLARTDMAGAFTAGFSETGSLGPIKFQLPQIVDLNGDTFPDLLWPTQTIRYSLQSPDHMALFPASSGLGATMPHAFAAGRIDGDNLNDVLVAGSVNQIFLQNPSDHSFAPSGTVMAPITDTVSIIDVNVDGRPDIVSGPQALLACKAPAAAGTFSTQTVDLGIGGANVAWFFDLNGDTHPDALGLNPSSAQLVVALHQ